MRLAGIDAQGPTIRAPREVRETLARFGIAGRPGNVRLPPAAAALALESDSSY